MKEHITAPAPRFLLRLKILERILKGLNKEGIQTVCEIGPGLGDLSSLAAEVLDPAGIALFDSSEAARELLVDRFGSAKGVSVHGEFVPNRSYDAVLCCEVVEHIDNDCAFLEDIHTPLNDGGVLIGSVPAFISKWQSADIYGGHYRRYEYKELVNKLGEAGFSDIEIYPYGFPLVNLTYLLRQAYYSSELRGSETKSKQDATEKSGISRGLVNKLNKNFVYFVVAGFSLLQSMPWPRSFHDGFVFKGTRA